MGARKLQGPRYEIDCADSAFPAALRDLDNVPDKLYVIGEPDALRPGLGIIGARKATPYGLSCARRFARLASEKGVCIVSGGARGCDSEAHRASLAAAGQTVAFLGGGCDSIYPPEHFGLFQDIIDAGGAVVSEHTWAFRPRPYAFRERNRLIAALSVAVLIVEAGLPSGTFSTADEALNIGKEVLVVPGAITSPASHGSNRLLYQGAIPIIDDETFEDVLFATMGLLKRPQEAQRAGRAELDPIIEAIRATPMRGDEILELARKHHGQAHAREAMMEILADAQIQGLIARQPDGLWGPVLENN